MIIISSSVMLLIIFLIDTSSISSGKMLRYVVRRFYCDLHWSVILPSYNTKEVVPFPIMSDDPIDNVFVIIRVLVASLAVCILLG